MPDHEATPMETVLLGWARDADGDSQRFTGDDIYSGAGRWCMDRLRRDIPTVVTYHCRSGNVHFAFSYAMTPEHLVLLDHRGELRARVDEIIAFEDDGQVTWRLWIFKSFEDA